MGEDQPEQTQLALLWQAVGQVNENTPSGR
jgi:hypothetical protein